MATGLLWLLFCACIQYIYVQVAVSEHTSKHVKFPGSIPPDLTQSILWALLPYLPWAPPILSAALLMVWYYQLSQPLFPTSWVKLWHMLHVLAQTHNSPVGFCHRTHCTCPGLISGLHRLDFECSPSTPETSAYTDTQAGLTGMVGL